MIKKVKVDDLRPGVFITDFGRKWFKHPFITNKVRIKNYAMIEKIRRSGIQEVFIDTTRGLDVIEHFNYNEIRKYFSSADQQFAEDLNKPKPTPLFKELPQAKIIRQEAYNVIKNLSAHVKTGRPIDLKVVTPVVDDVLESVSRNQDALMTLLTIKNRDQYTYMHSVNVSVLMAVLLKSMYFPPEKIKDLTTGAFLHDIGKSQIPIYIINKTAPLTSKEFEIMKRHAEIGLKLLEKTEDISQDIKDIVYQHHERLDGLGYPKGLTEKEISFGAKATAICDIYDAMTNDRSYSNARSSSDVLRYLFELGQQNILDFELVQKFIHAVGVYPIGTLVRLNSGFLGLVVETNKHDPLRPVVRLVYDTRHNMPIPSRDLDLASTVGHLHEIVDTESPLEWNIKPDEFLKAS